MGMGLTLMADDLSLLVGEVRGVQSAIEKRLDAQDQQRAEMHVENTRNINEVKSQVAATNAIALDSKRWIDEQGKPLVTRVDGIHERVLAIENNQRIAEAEERGAGKTWGLVGGAVVTGGGAIGGLIGYWRDIMDFFKGLGHGG